MRTRLTSRLSLLFMTFALVLALPAIALADTLANALDDSLDGTFETMALETDGKTQDTLIYVVPVDGDGGSGLCNFDAVGDKATVTVASNNTSVATAKWANGLTSIDFTGCGKDNGKTLTVTSGSAASEADPQDSINPAEITFTTVNAFGRGSLQTNFAHFKVTTSAPSNTPPSVSVTGVQAGASYEINDVPTAGCSVNDAEDTNESATPVFDNSGLNSYGLGPVQVSCSYTDGGGVTETATATYTIVDTGAPVITDLGPTTAANGANGWYTSTVTNTFQAEDFNGTTPTPDVGAGFAGQTNPYTFTKNSGTAEGSSVTIASGTVTDVAGNTGVSLNSAAFKIDLNNPTNVQFSGGPAADSSHYFGSVPAAPTCTADDAISGVEKCEVSGYKTTVGTHTMTATATDNAGRTTSVTRSYTVLAWTLNGFKAPVDMGIMNYAKGGSTVPLKFEVFAGSTELTSTNVVSTFTQKINCVAGPGDAIEEYSTGNTELRYDATSGQFIFNWKTPKAPGSCYKVTMSTQDGSSISANFQLK